MEWNNMLWFGFGLTCFLIVRVMAQQIPDIEHQDWTANWTWKLGDTWPPFDGLPSLFPNISESELQSRQVGNIKSNLDGRDTSCDVIQQNHTQRVYQCNLRIPGANAKSNICGDISGANAFGCDWNDDQVTICHRWRDAYTQSVTFCRHGEDTCSELDSRYMICACSVFYSYTTEQYYTFCDCKGALTDNYDDGCAFSYFGLLETPTQDRICRPICSRTSTCKECATGWSLSAPGVVTLCMSEDTDDRYGRRKICPCPEQYHNNTACNADYEPYSGDCKATTTSPSSTVTWSQNASDPESYLTPIQRGAPRFNITDMANTTTTTRQPNEPIETSRTPAPGTTTSNVPTSTISKATTDATVKEKTVTSFSTTYFQTTSFQTSLGHSTTKGKGGQGNHGDSLSSRLLTDTAVAAIIFGGTGFIVLLIILLLLCVLCLRCRNRGKRRDSSSKATLRADEFTVWRSTDNLNLAHENSLLSRASTSVLSSVFNDNASAVTEDSGPIYKDYFQVLDNEQDRIGASVESLYYFKLNHTPNGSISGLQIQEDFAKAKKELGSTVSLDSCSVPRHTPKPEDSSGGSVGKDTNKQTEDGHLNNDSPEQENPYYFKVSNKKDDHDQHDVQKELPEFENATNSLSVERQESIEENPYYFKVDPKDNKCLITGTKKCTNNGDDIDIIMLDTLLTLEGVKSNESKGRTTCPTNATCPKCTDGHDGTNDDYQSLRKKPTKASSERMPPELRYSYLLKPTLDQCPDDDYLSLRKIRPNQETCCEDDDYLKLSEPCGTDYHHQCSNVSEASSSNYFPLISTSKRNDNDTGNSVDEGSQFRQPNVEDGQNSDYQVLNKRGRGQPDVNGIEKENDYQLLGKRALNGASALPNDADNDYQLLNKSSKGDMFVKDIDL